MRLLASAASRNAPVAEANRHWQRIALNIVYRRRREIVLLVMAYSSVFLFMGWLFRRLPKQALFRRIILL